MKSFLLLVLLFAMALGCNSRKDVNIRSFKPAYASLAVLPGLDTLSIPLDSLSYRSIKAVSFFTDAKGAYLSFYDKHAMAIDVYDYRYGKRLKHISIKELLGNRKLKKTSAYLKNWDTLLVLNDLVNLYFADSAAKLRDSIQLTEKAYWAFSDFTNTTLPVFDKGALFITAQPYLDRSKLSDLKRWKLIYKIDLKKGTTRLLGDLSQTYLDNRFTIPFLLSSYCHDDAGLLLSLPADSNLYRVDDAPVTEAYYAKSQHQSAPIAMSLEQSEGPSQKTHLLSDSYGPVIYDKRHQRYLRVYEQKLSLHDYRQRNWNKSKTLILLDSQLQVVGESPLPAGIDTDYYFFDDTGALFIRTNSAATDRIQFIPLHYTTATTVRN